MGTSTKLDIDENCKNMDITKYQGMIDLLLYLTASILDIIFCVCLDVCFQACPKESDITVIKCICHCLHGTIDLWFWYSNEARLV